MLSCAHRHPTAHARATSGLPSRTPARWGRATPADASSALPHANEIIQRRLNGDQAAWREIVRLYWRTVFNVAYTFVDRHEQAEDLAQDVFLKLFTSLDTFDRRANCQTWLTSVSRNLGIEYAIPRTGVQG